MAEKTIFKVRLRARYGWSRVAITALCVVAGFVGCQAETGSAVQGQVTLDGEAVAIGSISFLPTSGAGPKGSAAIEQGAYSIPATEKLQPGSYRVEISWRKPTGKKVASADPGMTIDETREAVPAKYNTASTLIAEIGGAHAQQDFAMISK